MPAFQYRLPAASPHAKSDAIWVRIDGLDERDHIVRCIREGSTFYEVDLLEYLAECGPRGGVFIDAGANIGNHSVFFGLFLADHVVSIEPTPALIPILRRNLAQNGVVNHTLHECGVGAAVGTARVVAPGGDEFNAGQTRLLCEPAHAAATEGGVPVNTLDAIARGFPENFPRVSLLKIDVEGMEMDVLRGAAGLLEKDRPQLVIELATPAERAQAEAFLAGLGYRNIGRFCHTPTYHFIDPSVHTVKERRSAAPRAEGADWQGFARQIEETVPTHDPIILVDESRWPTESLPARTCIPFLERGGQYWGLPADDAQAIGELERLRREGAACIAFVPDTFWWLQHYTGFAAHLNAHYRDAFHGDSLIIIDLRQTGGSSLTGR